MVNISPTIDFDLSRVTYFKNKGSQINQAKAKAVEQPNHAEMVQKFTGFIQDLINLEVGKLKTAADNTSNTEVQKTSQGNLDKYNAEKDPTVAPLVKDVAGELAKHVYAVKELLVQDSLATQEEGKELRFKANKTGAGGTIAAESAKELASQALESVKDRLSVYGISIDAGKAAQLQTEIIQELKKKPPEPKSETPEVTTEVVTKATSDTKQSDKAPTMDDIENFVKSIQQTSPALANLSKKSRKGLEVLSQRINSISEEVGGGAVDQATLEKFQNTIFPNLADEKKFTDAVSELSQGEKATLKTILCAVHGQADKDMTCNEMSVHARNINKSLGANSTSLKDINDGIDKLIKSQQALDARHDQQPDPDRLKTVNKLLKTFEEELKKADELSSAAEKVAAREEAQTKLLDKLRVSLDDNSIDVADLEMLKKVLAKPDSANSNYNERANKFLKDLNINTDDLKQWGSMAAMLAVGLIIFCPRAITGAMQAGTGLLNMTLGNGMLPMLLMNGFGGGNNQGINPIAAMMMRNNNQGSKAA
jgi:hypothetical protein